MLQSYADIMMDRLAEILMLPKYKKQTNLMGTQRVTAYTPCETSDCFSHSSLCLNTMLGDKNSSGANFLFFFFLF